MNADFVVEYQGVKGGAEVRPAIGVFLTTTIALVSQKGRDCNAPLIAIIPNAPWVSGYSNISRPPVMWDVLV